jgi:hypothetical protein
MIYQNINNLIFCDFSIPLCSIDDEVMINANFQHFALLTETENLIPILRAHIVDKYKSNTVLSENQASR